MIIGGDKGFAKTPKKKPSVFKKAVKTIVKKGIKFAVSPLSLGLTAGTVLYKWSLLSKKVLILLRTDSSTKEVER